MIDRVRALKDLKAEASVPVLASIAAAGSVALSPEAGIVVPALAFASVVSLSGLALVWRRAEAASKAAQQAASQCNVLAERLIRLEQQAHVPVANPVLRSTMAEVTGTVGLLGGVVRELAKNVAAQNRDVAELKDSLKGAPKNSGRDKEEGTTLRIMPEVRSVQQPSAEQLQIEPEPSLLPTARKAMEDEFGRIRLVTQAFDADGIEIHLQPIVALPQRRIRFYEALARLRLVDGTLLGPAEFLPLLERLGRAPEFDRRILERAMAVARHLVTRGSEAIVGVNLSPHSIDEPGFLWALAGLVDASRETLGKIVLEFPQESWRRLDADQKAALAALRDRGVPMSIDRAGDLQFNARSLADLGVRFLKLPADQMIAAAEQDDGRNLGSELGVRDFASALRRQGVKLVAERVEREDMVPALIELGVPLAQGFVFAAPRAVRAEVLGAPAQRLPSAVESTGSLLRRVG